MVRHSPDKFNPIDPRDNFALRDEIIERSLALLKRSGISRVDEVDDAGNYEWFREYWVDNIWILEELQDLSVYISLPTGTDLVCSFFVDGWIVRHWAPELVIRALEVLRRDMILDDLADV